MKTARHYLLGLLAAAVVCFTLTLLVPPSERAGPWLALGMGVMVQGPIGWWLVRAVGTPRFLLIWAIGIGTRLGLVAIFAFGLIPLRGLPLGPTLFTLVGILLSLLVVEVVVVNLGQSERRIR